MSRRLPLLRLLPSTRLSSTLPRPSPSPPSLPSHQQAEFERLQRSAAVSSAFQTPESSSTTTTDDTNTKASATSSSSSSSSSEGGGKEELNQGIFRGAPPEFQGDTNPKTGEVGGPKNEPLRWGGDGDWSYNGRVTDF